MEGSWRPDPTQRHELRWHDGKAWSEHVSDGSATAVDPLVAGDDVGSTSTSSRLQGMAAKAAAAAKDKAAATATEVAARRRAAKESPPKSVWAPSGSGPAAAAPTRSTSAPIAAALAPAGVLVRVTSHDPGRNAVVSVYQDRIERVKERSRTSISRARQDTEVIPMRSVSSVQARKNGIRTNVTVFTSGNTVEFRCSHNEAQQLKDALLGLITDGGAPPPRQEAVAAPAPAVSVADELTKLATLRDTGVLTATEFEEQKARLLG